MLKTVLLVLALVLLFGGQVMASDFYLESTSQSMGTVPKTNTIELVFNHKIGIAQKDLSKFIVVGEDYLGCKLQYKLSGNRVRLIEPTAKWIGKNIYIVVKRYDWQSSKYFTDIKGNKLFASQYAYFSNDDYFKGFKNYHQSPFEIVKIYPKEGSRINGKVIISFSSEPFGSSNIIRNFFATDPPRYNLRVKKKGKNIIVYFDGGNLVVKKEIVGRKFKDVHGRLLKTDYEFNYTHINKGQIMR